MFVRFRKLPNGGFEPKAAAMAKILCRGQWCHRANGGHCRMRPRCRWAIACNDNDHLEPYRIKVLLVENTRLDGKVKQEIVAALGTIDATWLQSFWAVAPGPELRAKNWELFSLQERTAFWQGVLARMGQIGDNRLRKDDRVAVRRAIHKVVPWVMESERKRLAVLEACAQYDRLKSSHALYESHIKSAKEMIARYTAELKKDEPKSAELARALLQAGLAIAELDREGAA
jgi:hypothetical protein